MSSSAGAGLSQEEKYFRSVEHAFLCAVLKQQVGEEAAMQLLMLEMEMMMTRTENSQKKLDRIIENGTHTMPTIRELFANNVADRMVILCGENGLGTPTRSKVSRRINRLLTSPLDAVFRCYKCEEKVSATTNKECSECGHWYLLETRDERSEVHLVDNVHLVSIHKWMMRRPDIFGIAKPTFDCESDDEEEYYEDWILFFNILWEQRLGKEVPSCLENLVEGVESYVVTETESGGNCICDKKLKLGKKVKRIPCGHLLHKKCLVQHLGQSTNKNCPYCRHPIFSFSI